MAQDCKNCRYNRKLKVGEKIQNTTRKGTGAFCNDCGKLVATFDPAS